MKKATTLLIAATCALTVNAQKIDFNLPGKESQSLEEGFANWAVGRATASESSFTDDNGNNITIKVESVAGIAGNAVFCNWWKDGVTRHSRLVGDGIYPIILDSNNNYTWSGTEPMGVQFTISGLPAGEHTLCAYHNNTDGVTTPGYPTIKVVVDGVTALTGVEQTIRATKESDAGMSYIRFTAKEGTPVTVQYISELTDGKTYINSAVAINALIFDRPNPKTQAMNPAPAHRDYHADCDNGSARLSWTGGSAAVKHHVMFGTSPDMMDEIAVTAESAYTVSNLTNLSEYFWRIDEEVADGTVYEGETWSFRPRHLAFPGAEGYGRYAIGGRGGAVYHVTSLDDDPDNPLPGTFRYGITKVSGPRTIVFDVSGYIELKGRLICSDKYVTIAGQTAPGKGIILRGAPFGMNSDGITRFMRIHRGYAATEAEQNKGLDGFGIAGGDHAIMDHCSIAWTTDEGFSSRGAKSITLQRTMISEALNSADHPNYSPGTCHGYAATIGGGQGSGVGSFHHNLLAHCEGRNWSISGGLTGSGAYDGAHDIFNNVVYNWGGRATDGGSHEINFVNNYYRKGAATTQNFLMRLQLEGTGTGTQSAYVSGNIREEINGTLTQDKLNTTYRYETSGGQTVTWEPFVSQPFFESYAKIETAEAALRNVLSDVGANMPALTEHDSRIIRETRDKTYTYTGSRTGKKGLIDHEEDAGGYEALDVVTYPESYDTDRDGMPDWWERIHGLDPNTADNNSDSDGDGYTALEDYLNWMATPHYEIKGGSTQSIDLLPLFAGYSNQAVFSTAFGKEGYSVVTDGNILKVSVPDADAVATISVICEEGGYSFSRDINIRVTGTETGIEAVNNDASATNGQRQPIYNTAGQRISQLQSGQIAISKGRKVIKK
uniref:Pectate lyase n=1 Tax=uncultured Prevotella sp. TaxID=159272 RepID=A0A6G8F1N8_9BACT|nr:hypothetical protein Prevot485_2880 [uncultured Prevotella sp.]